MSVDVTEANHSTEIHRGSAGEEIPDSEGAVTDLQNQSVQDDETSAEEERYLHKDVKIASDQRGRIVWQIAPHGVLSVIKGMQPLGGCNLTRTLPEELGKVNQGAETRLYHRDSKLQLHSHPVE